MRNDPEHARRCEVLGPELRKQLRQSYRCDCVERHDLRPGRVTLPVLEADPAEGILDEIEAVTGFRPPGCPYRQTREPFVAAVAKAHRAYSKGEMASRGRHSRALLLAVDAFDAAISAVEIHDNRANRPKPPSEGGGGTKPKKRRSR